MTTSQKAIADGGAVVSAGVAALTWVTNLNSILQVVATIVAIVAGSMSAWYYYKKARELGKGN